MKRKTPNRHKKSWKPVSNKRIRHVWANPDGSGEVYISPEWYQDNGTPMCDSDSEWGDDEDMIYVRTELKA